MIDNTSVLQRETIRFFDKGADWLLATGPRVIFAIIVLLLGLWIIRMLRRGINRRMERKNIHSSLKPFFESLVFTGLHAVLFFLIMQILGVRLTMFAAVVAAFGAAAGLALSGTLQNFASGVLILLLKPFNVDDNINAQGIEGTVTSIQIFYTVITTYDKKTVIMPNSKLSNEVITNITQQGIRRLDVPLKFSYATDYPRVKEALDKLFSDLKEVMNDPIPRVGISAIDKDDYTIACNVWVNAHGFEDSRLLVNERIVSALREAGIYKAA